jgi:hypothetical protein
VAGLKNLELLILSRYAIIAIETYEEGTRPLSVTRQEEIQALRDWVDRTVRELGARAQRGDPPAMAPTRMSGSARSLLLDSALSGPSSIGFSVWCS